MKKVLSYLMIAAVAVLICASCSKDSEDPDDKKPDIPDEPVVEIEIENAAALSQNVFADAVAGDTLKLKAAAAWTSEITETTAARGSAPEWISVSPASGNAGNYKIAVILEENRTGNDRSAKITISSENEQKEISITQRGTTADGNSYEKQYDIYIGGHSPTGMDDEVYSNSSYIKNGEKKSVFGESVINRWITDFAVTGDDVHFAVKVLDKDGYYVKNGEATKLPLYGSREVYPDGMCVKGTDVYIGGHAEYSDTPWNRGMYWKNNVPHMMNSGRVSADDLASGSKIAVADNDDVYLLGSIYTSRSQLLKRGYWKNGEFTDLFGGFSSIRLNDICISGQDVYIVGTVNANDESRAAYWKNGELLILTDSRSGAYSIAVSGNDVYISGFDSGGSGYWKNGEFTRFSGTKGIAQSISVVDNDVYVMVTDYYYQSTAGIFKNGVRIESRNISESTKRIIVVPHSPSRTW
ncbi:MAG: BACON domain-containing protein [Prevotellaceae bacterium]|nr:BACON domain-containing protein [Prevotellaceae bacterium]